jgi:hypothetical protein
MTKLKEVGLGQAGIDYLLEWLKGAGGLSTALAKAVNDGGTVFAPVPDDVTLDRAKQFNAGGLMRDFYASAWFASHLSSLCRSNPGSVVIFQDSWVEPNFPAVAKSNLNKFFHGSTVYYFLDCKSINASSLDQAIHTMSSFLFIAAFVEFPLSAQDIPADRYVSDQLVGRLAQSTQEVFVGAFNQEGLVVWNRSASMSQAERRGTA